MTIYGPDISNYQAGLYLAQLRDASFVIAKCTEGTYYQDRSYPSWQRQAQAAGQLFVWYHFLTRENVQAQVANNRRYVVDGSLPGMLDIEPAYGYSPTLQQVLDYIDEAHRQKLNLRLAYLPRWYWDQMGRPDLGQILARGVHLVNSGYPGGAGTAPQIYPGDKAPGWQAFGGVPVEIYQFTNQALDGGTSMDYNAYLGTLEQLRQLLAAGQPAGGTDMTYTVGAGWQADYPDAAAELQKYAPVGTQMDAEEAASYSAMRSIVTAYRTAQIESKLDQVLATLANPTALAAAIAAHIQGGGGVDQAALTQFIAAHLHVQLAES